MLIDRILIKFMTGMQNASAAIFSNGIRKLDISAVPERIQAWIN